MRSESLSSRRRLLLQGGGLLLSGFVPGFIPALLGQEENRLDVASAGSARSILDGPIKAAVLEHLKLDLHPHAEGADTVARALVSGALKADVFIPITASPMFTVLRAGEASTAKPIARTELVLVYSPKSKYASRFAAAARGDEAWWRILQEPDMRIGRGDPTADPGARAILFALMLAAEKYKQQGLAEKILGSPLNPAQMIPGAQARLLSGDLDVTASYKIAALSSGLPYIDLPEDINLSRENVRKTYPSVKLIIGDQTYFPEPLVFYAAQMKHAAHPDGATAFLQWLSGTEAQEILRQHGFLAPETAVPLSL